MQAFRPHRPQVEPELAQAQPAHLPHHRPAELIPGGEFIAPRQHRGALPIHQAGPFPPQGFGKQEMGGAWVHQGSGVELHEFHVAE